MNVRKMAGNASTSGVKPASPSEMDRSHIRRVATGALYPIARAPSAPVAGLIAEDGERRA
jgi:hypothetical protein